MTEEKTVEIYIYLLEEGTDTIRPTQALDLGDGTYKLLPTENYDPEDEIWEFLPGTIVRCKVTNDYTAKGVLLACEQVK